MDWQQAFLARLLASADFIAAAGADAAGDASAAWLDRPQGDAMPAVTLQLISSLMSQNLQGFDDLQESRVQVDVWGAGYGSVAALFAIVLEVLVPPSSDNGWAFTRAMVEAPRDLSDREADTPVFRKSVDLIVHHQSI